jgi:hypothetical protein
VEVQCGEECGMCIHQQERVSSGHGAMATP